MLKNPQSLMSIQSSVSEILPIIISLPPLKKTLDFCARDITASKTGNLQNLCWNNFEDLVVNLVSGTLYWTSVTTAVIQAEAFY